MNCFFNMLCDPGEHRHKGAVSNLSLIKTFLLKEMKSTLGMFKIMHTDT